MLSEITSLENVSSRPLPLSSGSLRRIDTPLTLKPQGRKCCDRIHVCLRLRGLFPEEVQAGDKPSIIVAEPETRGQRRQLVELIPPSSSMAFSAGAQSEIYEFDKVLLPSVSQEDVFSATVMPLVDEMLPSTGSCENQRAPQSSVIFAFGVSNSGKSFTLIGTQDEPGILPRSMSRLFDQVTDDHRIWMSCVEVYNETVRDLLSAHSGEGSKRRRRSFRRTSLSSVSDASRTESTCKVREGTQGFFVEGLTHLQLRSVAHGEAVMRSAQESRCGPTAHSSVVLRCDVVT